MFDSRLDTSIKTFQTMQKGFNWLSTVATSYHWDNAAAKLNELSLLARTLEEQTKNERDRENGKPIGEVRKYLKRPTEIRAVPFTGDNIAEIEQFVGKQNLVLKDGQYYIVTLEGEMVLNVEDYVIEGVKKEIYPVRPKVIAERYNHVEGITYRKKPIVVTAIKYTGNNLSDVITFANGNIVMKDGKLYIRNHRGDMLLNREDYVLPNADTTGFFVHEGELFEQIHDLVVE